MTAATTVADAATAWPDGNDVPVVTTSDPGGLVFRRQLYRHEEGLVCLRSFALFDGGETQAIIRLPGLWILLRGSAIVQRRLGKLALSK